uniref:Uncharacterized protein n=1 Tax=Romanomermis culicivorax TaxID=13658 RepID=A0A915KPL9_ROMCU
MKHSSETTKIILLFSQTEYLSSYSTREGLEILKKDMGIMEFNVLRLPWALVSNPASRIIQSTLNRNKIDKIIL